MNSNSNRKRYTFEQLHNGALKQIPSTAGIYKVYKPAGFQMIFREDSDATLSENKLINVEDLKDKWKNIMEDSGYEDDLLYIGKAKNLRRRIGQYVRTGYGAKKPNHLGGRAIFQLADNKKLEIEYYEYENCKVIEALEIEKYIENKGIMPFANWKRGEKVNR